MALPHLDIARLSVDERLALIGALWDSLAADPDSLPVSEATRRELRRRLAEYRRDRDPGVPWREALDEIERDLDNARGGEGRGG